MEDHLSYQSMPHKAPCQALVPVHNTVSRKLWHVICKADLMVPLGWCFLKIDFFLIYYDHRFYIAIGFEEVYGLPPSENDLGVVHSPSLWQCGSPNSIPMPCGAIPMAYGLFQLDQCPSYLGYGCQAPQKNQ